VLAMQFASAFIGAEHGCPHEPQLFGSVVTSVQVLLQFMSEPEHPL
jgi:hypothetical protein